MWMNDIRDFIILALGLLLFAAVLAGIADVGFGLRLM